MIAGYGYEDPSVSKTKTLGTNLSCVLVTGSTPSVSFTVPDNGKIIIQVQAYVLGEIENESGDNKQITFALSDTTTTSSHIASTERLVFQNDHQIQTINVNLDFSATVVTTEWLLTALTPGATNTYYLHAGSTNGGSNVFVKWGGVYPPLIMKALTAP